MAAHNERKCQIRAENARDLDGIHSVNVAAFPTADEADLVDRLRSNGTLSVSLVAENDGVIVGHVAFSPVTVETSTSTGSGVGLAPVAVSPAHQRTGIVGRLIRLGLEQCRQAGYAYVVVLGDPAYYRRFGFETAAAKGLVNEYGAHDEFMVLELIEGSLRSVRGLVKYGAEFGAF